MAASDMKKKTSQPSQDMCVGALTLTVTSINLIGIQTLKQDLRPL